MKTATFNELALLCENLERTKSRLELARMIGQFLEGLGPAEIPIAVLLILGRVFPEGDTRTLEVSGATLWRVIKEIIGEGDYEDVWEKAVDFGEAVKLLFQRQGKRSSPPQRLTIEEVYRVFEEIAETRGPGSRGKKEGLLKNLLVKATPLEAKYIVKNAVGEMRHGVSEGMILEAIARTKNIDIHKVRRANMICGDIGQVAQIAFTRGAEGLKRVSITLFRPLKPMLAQTAEDVREAFQLLNGQLALEYKLDGARVQIHKTKEQCRLFSRRLTDITDSLPEICQLVMEDVKAEEAILEGEVIPVDSQGRPLPFQQLMRRFRRVHEIQKMIQEVPVKLYLFDMLYKDGALLIDFPYEERWRILEASRGKIPLAKRLLPRSAEEGMEFFHRAVDEGYEGVMAKSLSSKYTPGIRGGSWLKIKKAVSLDLVIIAADYGYGRRHGWLSNYHLAARDEKSGELLMVGKTFKGLTDAEFEQMTRRLQEIKIAQRGGTVIVEPKVVVEVLFSDIQRSPHYKSGLALRFARITRIREDKRPDQIDTIQTMRRIYEQQFRRGHR